MVVDIEKGDTFVLVYDTMWQHRRKEQRTIKREGADIWADKVFEVEEVPVPRNIAEAWIRSLGHTVQHTDPTPTYPVVRVADCTHGVRYHKGLGVGDIGTEEEAKASVKHLAAHGLDSEVVALDWTGVGFLDDATLKAALSVPIPPSPSPFPRKQPEPLASNANYTLEDARPAPFKVGDVVRGKVVDERWMVKRNSDAGVEIFGVQRMASDCAALSAGAVTRVALVEVSEGETK